MWGPEVMIQSLIALNQTDSRKVWKNDEDMDLILLLSPRVNSNSAAIEIAAIEAGWSVRRLENWRAPQELVGRDDVVAYGEPLFVAAIADALQYSLIEPPFNWLPSLPIEFSNRAVQLTTLAAARLFKEAIFAKPADDKCFLAGVFECGSTINASELLSGSTPVLVSEIVQWVVEYRFFVMEDFPVASSVYARNGERVLSDDDQSELNQAKEFVLSLLSDTRVALPPAVTLDVGIIAGRGWSVVEANPVFGSGIYFCDPRKVLPVLARSIVSPGKLTQRDTPWIITRMCEDAL